MLVPEVPGDEENRIATLHGLNILDTPSEERFDRLTRLTQRLLDVPIAVISLVDSNRQWFKSCQGLDVSETPRSISFCGHAILDDQIFIIPDATLDPRFSDNPLVIHEPNIRFYAGQPLKAANGSRIGTLCVIDRVARQLTQEACDSLRDLAILVENELNTLGVREAADTLQRSKDRLSAILDNVLDGIITIDERGIIGSFNKSAEAIFGYAAAEVIGCNVKMLMPEPYHSEHDGYLHNFVSTDDRKVIGIGREVTGLRRNGSTFPMDLAVSEMRYGNKRMFTGIVRDITERNLAIETRRNDEARLSAILDNVLDGIITIDEQGTVSSFNRSAEKIFGYEAAEVIGSNVKMLMPEPYYSEHDGYLHNFVHTGRKKIIGMGRQVVGRRRDGSTFPMDLAVSQMQLGDKRMFTGIVRDITERVKHERLKSEFISTVSHELRTPLTSIRGSLALVTGGVVGELPAAVKPLIEIAHKNSERLILLVNDILDMEKIEAGRMEFDMRPLSLMPLLRQTVEAVRAYGAQYNVSFELENQLAEIMLQADENRLMQVLTNLLSNAAKFSPSGGCVRIAVVHADQRVRVEIRDNGSGIPDEFKGQIFKKFAQADASDTRKKGGTGLGLSITRAIVEQMGGDIGFTSQPGVLTTFFVEFPIWQEPSAVARSDADGKKRILICEDNLDVAALLRLMLEQEGLVADIACDAFQAKRFLAERSYDAMTLDLSMPGQDGISLIRELRSKNETVPIVVVSADADEGRRELNSNAFSVIDWIDKPVDRTVLVAALQLALGGGGRSQVLHVEDDADVARVVNAIVGDLACVDHALTIAAARRMLKTKHYDLAILDLALPDGSGMDFLADLNGASPPVPVMVFSAQEVTHEALANVKAALVKSRTDNAQLLATIRRLIGVE